MLIVESYALAVVLCVVTMLCWGSWANTQKLASKEWRFQLFYWDYAIGVLLLALLLALTLGSTGPRAAGFSPTSPRRSGRASGSPSWAASSSTSPTSSWSPPSTSPEWPSRSRSGWDWRSCSG